MTLTNYWWLLIWMFTGGSLLAVLVPRRRELVCGEMEERWDTIPAVILVVPYIIWAGFRTDASGDSPLSSKKQKNNCRQRYPGFGCPFFNSFQGPCLLVAA